MKIKFIKPIISNGKIKCTVHTTGKLGFSKNAIKYLNIDNNSFVKIGVNEDDDSDKDLYLVVTSENNDDTFKVNKAGDYYYLNTKYLFDELNIDYRRQKIIYDINEIKYEGARMFRLNPRIIQRKKNK